MAFRTFDQTATAAEEQQVHRFRVGSGAGNFLLQRLASFTSQQRHQPLIERSAVTTALSRTPPRFPMTVAAAAATIIVAGMIFYDHATISMSAAIAGALPAIEANMQKYNADNETKGTSRLYIGTSIPRPNTPWVQPVSRQCQKTQVPTEPPTREVTTMSTITSSKLIDLMSPHTYALVQGRACIGKVLELTVNHYSVGLVAYHLGAVHDASSIGRWRQTWHG